MAFIHINYQYYIKSISNYYFIKGVRQMENYEALCEPNAIISMLKMDRIL